MAPNLRINTHRKESGALRLATVWYCQWSVSVPQERMAHRSGLYSYY